MWGIDVMIASWLLIVLNLYHPNTDEDWWHYMTLFDKQLCKQMITSQGIRVDWLI